MKKNTNVEDNVYYNIRITNDSEFSQPAVFKENRVQAILETPSLYELAVVRFSVPALFIPIQLWESPSPYVVSMKYDGTEISSVLQFIPRATNPLNPPYGEAIWNYQQFVDIINVALKDCFDQIKALHPAAPPTETPFMTFDAKTDLCSIYAEELYDTEKYPNTIDIFFDKSLYVLFPSFQTFVEGNGELFYQILVKDNKINSTTYNAKPYLIMEQTYTTLALWNSYTSIVFETDTIPVEPEFLPAQTNVVRRLLTDFQPLQDINNRQSFQFFPQGKVRYYDLKSSYPMKSIDLRAYWEDRNGVTYPIFLGKGDVLTMKLLFRKKSVIQLEETIFATEDDMN